MIKSVLSHFLRSDLESGIPKLFLQSNFHYNLTLLVTLLLILLGYYKHKASPRKGKKLPPGSYGHPFIGETISFLRAHKQNKTSEWVQTRVKKYGPVFKTSLMGSKAVLVTGQAGNKFLFRGGENGIGSSQIGPVKSILGHHSIFELSGSRHKLVRDAIMSFLRPESLQKFVGEMDYLIKQQLLQEFDGKDIVHMVPAIKKIAFDVSCNFLFGLPEGKEKGALLEDFTLVIKGLWSIPLNFPGTIFYEAMQARRRICAVLTKLINRRKTQLQIKAASDDVISRLIDLRDENDEELLEDEIIDNLISLVIASHDTTSSLLSIVIRHLARDSKVCNKVLEEQMQVNKAREGNKEGKLTWNDVQTMKYTWKVAQELMRLNPPIFGNFKCASRDTNFGGYDIPKGWQVLWVAPGTHMDKNIFQDPEKFDPDRFDRSSKLLPPYTYIPFGAGPRICPGSELARIESLLVIHNLITNYQWTEVIPDEPITSEPIPYPAKGLPVKLFQQSANDLRKSREFPAERDNQ